MHKRVYHKYHEAVHDFVRSRPQEIKELIRFASKVSQAPSGILEPASDKPPGCFSIWQVSAFQDKILSHRAGPCESAQCYF
jgi:hypothetical protein